MTTRVRTEPASHQAVCDNCGWHTAPYRNLPLVKQLAELHGQHCPAPPPPRNGAVLACGCWTFRLAIPGRAVGDPVECAVHGPTTYRTMNVPDPSVAASQMGEE